MHGEGRACRFRRSAASRVQKGGHPCSDPLYPGGGGYDEMKANRAGLSLALLANRPPSLATPSQKTTKPGHLR